MIRRKSDPAYDAEAEARLKRYKISIDRLQNAHIEPLLINRLIELCEMARNYDWLAEKETREIDRDARKSQKIIVRMVRSLANRIDPYTWAAPISKASLSSGVHLVAAENDDWRKGALCSPSHSVRLAVLLKALSDEIEKGGLLETIGRPVHRYRVGPLFFENAVDRQAELPSPHVCLAILLSFVFRRDSANLGRWAPGAVANVSGKPRWDLVTQLVRDALGKSQGDLKRAATAILKRHPNLKIYGYS